MTIKELKSMLNQYMRDFHLTEETGIIITNGDSNYDFNKVFPILIEGHVKINFDLVDSKID